VLEKAPILACTSGPVFRDLAQSVVHSQTLLKTTRDRLTGEGRQVDVVLSSGFLSFANHAGFLKAVEEVCFRVLKLSYVIAVLQA
jgi:hypothetical protein